MEKYRKALVLAGGGAKGSYQVGVYKALRELGWRPDIVVGTSVGSLNGVLLALGDLEAAERLWLSLEDRDVLTLPADGSPETLRDFVLDTIRSGGLDLQPLGEIIDDMVDEDRLRATPVRFGLVMTEMNGLKSVQLPLDQIPRGRLRDYLLASSACFPALRPREIDGVRYIDGGWRDNLPLHLAAAMGADELLGVDIGGIGVVRPNTTGLPTRVLHSHWDLGPLFTFDGERAARNIALGRLDTLRAFGRVGGTAYALLPDTEEFLPRFIAGYLALLGRVGARAPALVLTEAMARQMGGWPPPFEQDPTAPTRGAAAPLELAAERLGIPPQEPYTPLELGRAVYAAGRDRPERYAALLAAGDDPAVAEAALAAADPENFVTALVCAVLAEMQLS